MINYMTSQKKRHLRFKKRLIPGAILTKLADYRYQCCGYPMIYLIRVTQDTPPVGNARRMTLEILWPGESDHRIEI